MKKLGKIKWRRPATTNCRKDKDNNKVKNTNKITRYKLPKLNKMVKNNVLSDHVDTSNIDTGLSNDPSTINDRDIISKQTNLRCITK